MVGENVIDMVHHHFCVEKCEKKSVLQKSYLTLWHYSFAMADYVLVVCPEVFADARFMECQLTRGNLAKDYVDARRMDLLTVENI